MDEKFMSAEARPRIHGCKVDEGGNTFDILPLLHNLNSIYRIILEYCSLANMAMGILESSCYNNFLVY